MNSQFDYWFFLILFLFLLINSMKIAAFNLYVIGERKPTQIIYKFVRTLALMTVTYTGLVLSTLPLLVVIFYIVQVSYLYLCISYYNFYSYFLHLPQSLKLIRESLDVVRHHSVPRHLNQLAVFADLPAFLLIPASFDQQAISITKPFMEYIIFAFLVLILVFELANYLKGRSLIHLIKLYPNSEYQIVANYGTLLNMLIDLILYHTYDKLTKQFDYGKPKRIRNKGATKPNIIIIQAESLDSNALNLCFNNARVMPFLYSLSNESIFYPYMLNYHKAGGTSDAEFSIINSVEPLGNFPSIKIPSYPHANSFVRLLSADTYHTAVFHGNEASYYARGQAFSTMGFHKFYDIKAMDLKTNGWGAPDHDVYEFVLGMIEKQVQPYFFYLITMSNHCRFTNVLNYHPNSDFLSLKNKDLRNYFNSLSYVDKTLKSFVQKVRSLDKEAYILIFGDHTPGLPKKLYKEASLEIEKRHLEFVPFFLISAEGHANRENTLTASFLDIAPTVLELANINTVYTTYGESLIPPRCLKEKIPYRGYFFDRKDLYEKIANNE